MPVLAACYLTMSQPLKVEGLIEMQQGVVPVEHDCGGRDLEHSLV